MQIFDKITVIIPTYERHNFLERSLDYWSQTGVQILVADSSINKYQGQIPDKTNYFHFPNKLFAEKIVKVVSKVETDYSVLCADDDFITITGLIESVKFLETNSDYVVAHGQYISFWPPGNQGEPNGYFCWRPRYVFPAVDFEDPVERITYYFEDFARPIFYGVYRKDFMKLIWSESKKYTDGTLYLNEYFPHLLTLIYGKEKQLDVLYCLREIAPKRKNDIKDIADFVEEDSFDGKYERFKNGLVSHMCKVTSLDSSEAEKLIDSGVSKMIERRAPKPQTVKKSLSIIIKKSLKFRMPNIHRLIKSVYSKMLPFIDENTGVFYDFPPPKDQEYFRYTKQGKNICVEMPKYQDSDKEVFYYCRDYIKTILVS